MKTFVIVIVSLFCGWCLNTIYSGFLYGAAVAEMKEDELALCRYLMNEDEN